MKALTNLLSKVILFAMILTAPAMIAGNNKAGDVGSKTAARISADIPYYSSSVIKRFLPYRAGSPSAYREGVLSPASGEVVSTAAREIKVEAKAAAMEAGTAVAIAGKMATTVTTATTATTTTATAATTAGLTTIASKEASAGAELARVVNEAVSLYDSMNLAPRGLSVEAFEYAWRGYHNLLKKGLLGKKSVLSICDFSQSSRQKRMYIIDVRHKKLLFNTYVAHGLNSGAEYANSFSNTPESGKSSLGFYITGGTYYGRNGLSLKIIGVDKGYNDLASKRNIVLHGSSYICNSYLQSCGEMGTSLGCPAIPAPVSPRIIRTVKNGSCFFIYHPTRKYLAESRILHG